MQAHVESAIEGRFVSLRNIVQSDSEQGKKGTFCDMDFLTRKCFHFALSEIKPPIRDLAQSLNLRLVWKRSVGKGSDIAIRPSEPFIAMAVTKTLVICLQIV